MLYSSAIQVKSIFKTLGYITLMLLFESQITLVYSIGSKKINEVKIFHQGEEIHGVNNIFLIDTAGFSIRFYNKKYNPKSEEFYAARLAAFYDKDQIPEVKTGMYVNEILCFKPGTGMAPAGGYGYTALKFNAKAHHYLFYQDEKFKRVNKVDDKGEYSLFEFAVDSLEFWGERESLKETKVSQFYILLLVDRNLNNRIDEGECKIITVRLKKNYKGWERCYWNLQDQDGLTPLHKLLSFSKWNMLDETKRLQILKEALSCKSANLNLTDKYGYSALHYAISTYYISLGTGNNYKIKRNKVETIQCLLEREDVDINKRDFGYKQTAFMTLLTEKESHYNTDTYSRYDSLVKLFLKQDRLDLSIRNNLNLSVFYYEEDLKYLTNDSISGRMYNDNASSEMIKIIEQLGYSETLEADSAFFKKNIALCFDYDADPNFYSDIYNYSPLIWLCSTNNRPYGYTQHEILANMQLRDLLLKQFLHNPKTDVNLPNDYGDTPLHIAANNFNYLLVNTLIQDENIDINRVNCMGNTPLMTLLESFKYCEFDEQEQACLKTFLVYKDKLNFKAVNFKGNTVVDIIDKELLTPIQKDYLKKTHMDVYTTLIELKDFVMSQL